ncbi:hypothetical protein LMG29542_07010 [Paraburkholderia humisilvae]|uniref:Uncharacterized protein n=1 Tax=Paraburkholderia humisilvae TaxID=627669 RepID=A0A6J5F219_9BURK|nr:hypothetical protein LMG29542_07010 [Paraburkholderia humisilvae]
MSHQRRHIGPAAVECLGTYFYSLSRVADDVRGSPVFARCLKSRKCFVARFYMKDCSEIRHHLSGFGNLTDCPRLARPVCHVGRTTQ